MRETSIRRPVAAALLAAAALVLASPAVARVETRIPELTRLSDVYSRALEAQRGDPYVDLRDATEGPQGVLNRSRDVQVMYVSGTGRPVFYETHNLEAAETVSTDAVWPFGIGGFDLTGSSTTLDEVAIWDGGGVLLGHQEFGGRVVQQDDSGGTHFHATHVACTMVGAGVFPNAKGMSFEAALAAYDWSNDDSEMAGAAAGGLNVSNHSYGHVTGWRRDGGDWYWYGDPDVSADEDYHFGFYCANARAWDEIAANAPYYTIVKSAGNDRTDTGPGPGGGHWVWGGSSWQWSTETRQPDGGSDGFDTISWNGTAKNVITVGAVQDISGGYRDPSDVVMSSFSCWGPTDDGRIKPDLVANGVGLYSAVDDGPAAYAVYSGTSMAAPNLSGSLNLLIRHFEATHGGTTPLASTMKAILIETADEAGAASGPDYVVGWGLLNTLSAAELIEEDGAVQGYIIEDDLEHGDSDQHVFVSDGTAPVRVTIAWTDPPGDPMSACLDPPELMLVNDLDLRLEHLGSGTVHEPYVLDPTGPADPAGTGDNVRDNVEQIRIAAPAAGEYRVTVSHKGTLAAPQAYSIAGSHHMLAATTNVGGPPVGAPFALHGNFPNPFNPRTTIRYELAVPGPVALRVLDVSGRVVRTLVDGPQEAGPHEATWNGTNDANRAVASGVYYYELSTDGSRQARAMVLLK